ncbi:MAG: hypothetical protein ABSG41_26060 [Bryobacteraceae bacterium]|jgi:hypothetical protein
MPDYGFQVPHANLGAAYNGLMSALNQQAELLQQQQKAAQAQRQQGFEDDFKALQEGWEPVEGPSNDPGYAVANPGAPPNTPGNVKPVLLGAQGHVPLGYNRPGFEKEQAAQDATQGSPFQGASGTDRPTLAMPDNDNQTSSPGAQPAASPFQSPGAGSLPTGALATPYRDPSRMKQSSSGNWFYKPTEEEIAARKAANDPSRFSPAGPLADALEKAGVPKGTPMTPGNANTLMEALNRANPSDKTEFFNHVDSEGTLTVYGEDKTSGDVKVLQKFPGPAKQPTKKELHFEKDTNDAGDVTVRGFDPDSGALVSTQVTKNIGPHRKDPDAPKPLSKAQLLRIQDSRARKFDAADKDFQKAMIDARPAEQGGTALTPAAATAAQQDAIEARRKAKATAQLEFESDLSIESGGKEIPHDARFDSPVRPAAGTPGGPAGPPAPDAMTATPPPPPNAPRSQPTAATVPGRGISPPTPQAVQPAAAPGAKTLSLQQLDAYVAAQQKTNPRFTKADAIREAGQRGYKIQGKKPDPRALIPLPVHASSVHAGP